jgi:phosphatidylserine synthase
MNNRPTILSFVKDIPNIITLLGLSCGVIGIYFAILENFPAAVIAIGYQGEATFKNPSAPRWIPW